MIDRKLIAILIIVHISYAHPLTDTEKSSIEEWDLRHTIPGEPDIDYPIYAHPIKTNFNCDGRHQGYYADIETRCQLFRICTNTDLTGEGFAFLCPNGTLFSQQYFICDWYKNVDCGESESYYFKNEEIGNSFDHDELMETAKEMVEYPMISKQGKSITQIMSSISNQQIYDNQLINSTNQNLTTSQNDDREIIDIRFGINDNTTNQINQSITKTTGNNQQQRTTRTKQQINNSRISTENNSKFSARAQTASPYTTTSVVTTTTTNRPNLIRNGDKLQLQEKVYVNSLGELSTDYGTNFDPKTSLILNNKSNDNRRGIKKSLDDVIGDSTAYRNHLENRNKELLKNGVQTQYQEYVSQSTKFHDQLKEQSKMKLSFAAKVNAGLNDDHISLTRTSSLLPSEIGRTAAHHHSHDNFINLADNINSGLFQKKSDSNIPAASTIHNSPSVLLHSNSEIIQPSVGRTFQGYQTIIPQSSSSNFRQGRQFQFSGSAFARSGISSDDIQPSLNTNAYLPPFVSNTRIETPTTPQSFQTPQKLNHYQSQPSYILGNQPGTNPVLPALPKPSVSFTEIPGTNIKISKSNEEATIIYSSDSRHLAQFKTPAPTSASQKNGYVPLNEYITNTLNGQIRNLASQAQVTQPKNQITQQIPQQNTNYQHQQQNILFQQAPLQNYGQQFPVTTENPLQQQSYIQNTNNHYQNIFGNIGKPVENVFQKPENQLFYQTNSPRIQLIAGSYLNQDVITTQAPQTKLNIYNNLSPFSDYLFNQVPAAERRLDVVQDEEKESLYSKGISSYHVPIGSIGRLVKRF